MRFVIWIGGEFLNTRNFALLNSEIEFLGVSWSLAWGIPIPSVGNIVPCIVSDISLATKA